MGIFVGSAEVRSFEKRVSEIFKSGMFSTGPQTDEVEKSWESVFGNKSVAVSNGTTALELAMKFASPKKRPGAVLMPVIAPPMVAWAVKRAGYEVLMCDVDPVLGVAGPEEIESRITWCRQHGLEVAGVLAVHNGGVIHPKISWIAEFCRDHDLWMVEDCSHTHFATMNGSLAGSFGDAAAWSFYPTKVMMTAEGGIVSYRDPEMAHKAMVFSNQGKERGSGVFGEDGYNLRIGEFSAALIACEIEFMEDIIGHRRMAAEIYSEMKIPKVTEKSIVQTSVKGLSSTFYKHTIITDLPLEEAKKKLSGLMSGDTYHFLLSSSGLFNGALKFSSSHINLKYLRDMSEQDFAEIAKKIELVLG